MSIAWYKHVWRSTLKPVNLVHTFCAFLISSHDTLPMLITWEQCDDFIVISHFSRFPTNWQLSHQIVLAYINKPETCQSIDKDTVVVKCVLLNVFNLSYCNNIQIIFHKIIVYPNLKSKYVMQILFTTYLHELS